MKKIILVGDVGSTKSSWWITGTEPREINLPGFNPLVHDPEVGKAMASSLSTELGNTIPDIIWYYGAGVIDSNIELIIKEIFNHQFPGGEINVNSDLIGAAKAVCGYEPGTVVILGTGSHAAVYDGNKIVRQANSLGYILGDEGGGCDIGKALLRAYFYNKMPEPVKLEMMKSLPGERPAVMKQLYSSPAPNQYLATYARVAVKMSDNAWIRDLVRSRFRLFLKNHLLPLEAVEPVHILGSIGCIFADLIETELTNNALKAGVFLKDPSYRLFTMHVEHGD